MGDEEIEALRAIFRLELGVRVLAWCRMTKADIAAARRAGVDAVDLSIPASDRLLNAKLGVTRARRWRVCASLFRSRSTPVSRSRSAPRTLRAPMWIIFCASPMQRPRAGAFRLRIADTVGALDPFATHALVERIVAASGMAIEFHGHDDYGLATANRLAAARAGATHVSVTVGGLGERAGNAPLEEVAAALECLYGETTDVDLAQLSELAAMVGRSGAAQRSGRQGDRRRTTSFPTNRAFTSPDCWPIPRAIAVPIRRCSVGATASSSASTRARSRSPTRSGERGVALAEETAPLLVALVRRRATQSKTAHLERRTGAPSRGVASPRRCLSSCAPLNERGGEPKNDLLARTNGRSTRPTSSTSSSAYPRPKTSSPRSASPMTRRCCGSPGCISSSAWANISAATTSTACPIPSLAARAKATLQRAYADFERSSPLAERVFRVLKDHDPKRPAPPKTAFVGLDEIAPLPPTR